MEDQEISRIRRQLPKGRTQFYYYKDRYAQLLLGYLLAEAEPLGGVAMPIRQIRNSRFARLLDRPVLRDVIERAGSGSLTVEDLARLWPAQPECYLLTLGRWCSSRRGIWERDYHQTSRPGANLVLQLNFSAKHDKSFDAYLAASSQARNPFVSSAHPNSEVRNTLGWARLDMDLKRGEALIEEVQSDWIKLARYAPFIEQAVQEPDPGTRSEIFERLKRSTGVEPEILQDYLSRALLDHAKVWDEAILCAAIWFLRSELGIEHIFMHDFETGNFMKGMGDSLPPRTLYTALPKKFCFEKVSEVPAFLAKVDKPWIQQAIDCETTRFWYLNLPFDTAV